MKKLSLLAVIGLVMLFCQHVLAAKAFAEAAEEWQVQPAEGSTQVSVYPQLVVSGKEKIQTVEGYLKNGNKVILGEWQVEENAAYFSPYQILKPGQTYEFEGEVNGVRLQQRFNVSEAGMPKRWIEVALGREQRVYVWENNQIVKSFSCSGGLAESPSLTGIYQLKDRGESFYSKRFSEGAKYWIRIQDQYLFHSVPRDESGAVIQEELEKIGEAASHGCIRLYDEDAKWLYENIPRGTTVILHPALPDLADCS